MVASIIFDISLTVLAILIIVKFTVKGFVRSLLDLAKIMISLSLAFLLRVPVAGLVSSLFMNNLMVDAVRSSLDAYLNNEMDKIYVDVENMPEMLKSFLTFFDLDLDSFNSDFEAFFTNHDTSVIGSLSNNVGGALSMLISSAIAFVVITVISYIILSIIFHFVAHLRRFDDVKTADRILGVILGIGVAFVILFFFSQTIMWIVDEIGPIAPEYIDSKFCEKSMIISGSNRVWSFFKYVGNLFK